MAKKRANGEGNIRKKAADGLVAEAQILHTLVTFDSALGLGFVVELLDWNHREYTLPRPASHLRHVSDPAGH